MKRYDILSCFAAFPMALFAADERAFVPSPLTTVDVPPGHPSDGKGAEQLQGPFAEALRAMLDAGFPDPVGLAYRKITIPTGNCNTGDSGEVETEGWLLPAENFTLKPGMKIQVRRKDVVARALTDPDQAKKGKAAPALEYWWPKDKRDARIAEMINLLSGPT